MTSLLMEVHAAAIPPTTCIEYYTSEMTGAAVVVNEDVPGAVLNVETNKGQEFQNKRPEDIIRRLLLIESSVVSRSHQSRLGLKWRSRARLQSLLKGQCAEIIARMILCTRAKNLSNLFDVENIIIRLDFASI